MEDSKPEDFVVKMPESTSRVRTTPPKSRRVSISVNKVAIPVLQITHNPKVAILAYCVASISMTITNKYCVSGEDWNMNLFLLGFQVSHCSLHLNQDKADSIQVNNLHPHNTLLQIVRNNHLSLPLFLPQGQEMYTSPFLPYPKPVT
jgi:GDP-mannose transporter